MLHSSLGRGSTVKHKQHTSLVGYIIKVSRRGFYIRWYNKPNIPMQWYHPSEIIPSVIHVY